MNINNRQLISRHHRTWGSRYARIVILVGEKENVVSFHLFQLKRILILFYYDVCVKKKEEKSRGAGIYQVEKVGYGETTRRDAMRVNPRGHLMPLRARRQDFNI